MLIHLSLLIVNLLCSMKPIRMSVLIRFFSHETYYLYCIQTFLQCHVTTLRRGHGLVRRSRVTGGESSTTLPQLINY